MTDHSIIFYVYFNKIDLQNLVLGNLSNLTLNLLRIRFELLLRNH